MATIVETPVDAAVMARAIARAAADERKAMGRRCRLQDALAVQAFLTTLLDGRSLYAASCAAGFSEGVVRRWLKFGTASGATGVYAELAAAVEAIRVTRSQPPSVDTPNSEQVDSAERLEDERRRAADSAAARQRTVERLAHRLQVLTERLSGPPFDAGERDAINAEIRRIRREVAALPAEHVPGRDALVKAASEARINDLAERLDAALTDFEYGKLAARSGGYRAVLAVRDQMDRAFAAIAPARDASYDQRDRFFRRWLETTRRPTPPEREYDFRKSAMYALLESVRGSDMVGDAV
jgi:hypothetical protein